MFSGMNKRRNQLRLSGSGTASIRGYWRKSRKYHLQFHRPIWHSGKISISYIFPTQRHWLEQWIHNFHHLHICETLGSSFFDFRMISIWSENLSQLFNNYFSHRRCYISLYVVVVEMCFQGKTKLFVKNPTTLSTTNPTYNELRPKPAFRSERSGINLMSRSGTSERKCKLYITLC